MNAATANQKEDDDDSSSDSSDDPLDSFMADIEASYCHQQLVQNLFTHPQSASYRLLNIF